jgi:hypothetical protein
MPKRAIPEKTLEQLSALSLLQLRAGEAIINFRRAIDTAPLSDEARAELWQQFVTGLPHSPDEQKAYDTGWNLGEMAGGLL